MNFHCFYSTTKVEGQIWASFNWFSILFLCFQIFGPVLSLFSFKSQQEAVERANDSRYGLVSAVFTTSMDRALSVSGAMETGTVW